MTDLYEHGLPRWVKAVDLAEKLKERYPTHDWEAAMSLKSRFRLQRRLELAVVSLFPVNGGGKDHLFDCVIVGDRNDSQRT